MTGVGSIRVQGIPGFRNQFSREGEIADLPRYLVQAFGESVARSGRGQTDFITEAIVEKVGAIIRKQRLLKLTDRDMDALLAAIAAPPAPNEAMLRSVARWRERGAPV